MKNTLVAMTILTLGMVGCGSGSSTGTNQPNAQQGCTNGFVWNASLNTCVNPNIQQNYPVGQMNPNMLPGQTFPGQVMPSPVSPNNQQCAPGQYFNGTLCATTVLQQGDCATGQINTQGYGCVQQADHCENQYSYYNESGDCDCIPAPITLSTCKSKQIRRNGRVIISSSGSCANDAAGNYGTPKKVKFRRDGSIKKIKW